MQMIQIRISAKKISENTSPNPYGFVSTTRCKKLTIWAPGNTFYLVLMPLDYGLLYKFSYEMNI